MTAVFSTRATPKGQIRTQVRQPAQWAGDLRYAPVAQARQRLDSASASGSLYPGSIGEKFLIRSAGSIRLTSTRSNRLARAAVADGSSPMVVTVRSAS